MRNDIKGYEDLTLDNEYNGPMNENTDDIISSLKVSFITKRILYMNESGKGLKTYNLMEIITECPTLMQSIFVTKNEGKRRSFCKTKTCSKWPLYGPCSAIIVSWCLFQETQRLFAIWVEFKHFRSILESVFVLQIEEVILQSEDQKV